jgi:hypothetical protein
MNTLSLKKIQTAAAAVKDSVRGIADEQHGAFAMVVLQRDAKIDVWAAKDEATPQQEIARALLDGHPATAWGNKPEAPVAYFQGAIGEIVDAFEKADAARVVHGNGGLSVRVGKGGARGDGAIDAIEAADALRRLDKAEFPAKLRGAAVQLLRFAATLPDG